MNRKGEQWEFKEFDTLDGLDGVRGQLEIDRKGVTERVGRNIIRGDIDKERKKFTIGTQIEREWDTFVKSLEEKREGREKER